jgi:uncharacterized membrane protein YhaH (DUF805 family)
MLLLRPLMRYADFKGRASRAEYWLFLTTQGLVYLVCVVMGAMSLANHDMGKGLLGLVGWLAVALLLMAVFALPNYAVLARRLHDTGRSALWMALMLPTIATNFMTITAMGSLAKQAPVAGLDGGVALKDAALSHLAGVGGVGMVASVCSLVLFVLTMLPGTRGPNRFGPDPKDPDAEAPSEHSGLDTDRWDALIAEAKGAVRSEEPYRPVLEFGPGSAQAAPAAVMPRPAVDWDRPAWDPGVAPSRPFGRRT